MWDAKACRKRGSDANEAKRRVGYAQRPSTAMSAHPSIMHPRAYMSFPFDAVIISLLNRNSCASSCVGEKLAEEGQWAGGAYLD